MDSHSALQRTGNWAAEVSDTVLSCNSAPGPSSPHQRTLTCKEKRSWCALRAILNMAATTRTLWLAVYQSRHGEQGSRAALATCEPDVATGRFDTIGRGALACSVRPS